MEIETNNEKLLNDFEPVSFDVWKKEVEDSLKGKPFAKLFEKTFEDIDIKPIYTKEDLINNECIINSFPGFEPFLRGNDVLGSKLNPWKIAQKINHPIAANANQILKDELSKGTTAINVKLFIPDLSFQIDENDLPSGVHIYNTNDIEQIFDGINISDFPIYIELAGNIAEGLKLVKTWAKNIKSSLYVAFDPVSNYLSKGFLVNNFESVLNELLSDNENHHFICCNSGLYQNSGASSTQEIAFSLAIVNYFLNTIEEGNIDKLLKSLWINTSIGSNFFMEIAKLRAMRILLSKLVSLYDLKAKFPIHAKTTTINKSKLDAYTNMLRLNMEALSAIFGGADSIEVGYFDEMFGISNENSRKFSRNLQIILQKECNLEVIDPAGGSYYIEKITAELAEKSWELFQHIENIGGMKIAIKDGHIQKWITAKANERIDNVKSRKDILLGVNKYANMNEKEIISEKIDISTLKNSFEINKSNNDSNLNKIFNKENLIEVTGIEKLILAKPFEDLKEKSQKYIDKNGNKPKIFFANFGTLKEYKPRAEFANDFFTVGNFEIINPSGFQTIEDAITVFFHSEATAICICSSDDKYPEIIEYLVRLVRKAKPFTQIILAGYPVDKVEEYRANGIDDFIHIKANIYNVLNTLYDNIVY